MGKRKIVEIDQEKCNGCGLCINACAEGAIQLVDGKAQLVTDSYCDGLGACLGECPQDAIKIIEREADEFDEEAVDEHLQKLGRKPAASGHAHGPSHGGGCPGAAAFAIKRQNAEAAEKTTSTPSQLQQWPVQLHLVPVNAPYWQDAELLIAADCVPFSYADFHSDLLRDHKLIIACPKLDNTEPYLDKLTAIISENSIRSVTVAHMEVPCCTGIQYVAKQALDASGKQIPFTDIIVSIDGKILKRETTG